MRLPRNYALLALLSVISHCSGDEDYKLHLPRNVEPRVVDIKDHNSLKRFHPESVEQITNFRDGECHWKPVLDSFGAWPKTKNRFRSKTCVLQECYLPAKLKDGDGYIHIHRIGPATYTGQETDKTVCYFLAHTGPVGSYMKAYFAAPFDYDSGEPLGFPPIHIHHLETASGNRNEYLNYASQKPEQTFGNPILDFESAHSFGGPPVASSDQQCYVPDDVHDGMGCLYVSIADGKGWRLSADRGPQISQVYVEDYREKNSPPLRTVVDFITIWLTEPKVPMQSVVPASFGVWGHGPKDEGHALKLPMNQESITMASFVVPWNANFSNFYYHMHSVAGDEGWLIRGKVADVVEPPRDVAGSFYTVSTDLGYGDWNPDFALPITKLGFGDGVDLNMVKAMWHQKILNSRGAASIMCRYQANAATISKGDRQVFGEKYRRSIEEGKITKASRLGWKSGQYYRYNTETGPNCDTFTVKAGEVFSLLQFSVARQHVEANVHVTLLGFVHFDEEDYRREPNRLERWEMEKRVF